MCERHSQPTPRETAPENGERRPLFGLLFHSWSRAKTVVVHTFQTTATTTTTNNHNKDNLDLCLCVCIGTTKPSTSTTTTGLIDRSLEELCERVLSLLFFRSVGRVCIFSDTHHTSLLSFLSATSWLVHLVHTITAGGSLGQ